MKTVILKIAPAPNYSLRIESGYEEIVKKCTKLYICLDVDFFEIKNGMKTYQNNGRITDTQINEWIRSKNLHVYPKGYPYELEFTLAIEDTKHTYKFILIRG
jgi:hypothetical protein